MRPKNKFIRKAIYKVLSALEILGCFGNILLTTSKNILYVNLITGVASVIGMFLHPGRPVFILLWCISVILTLTKTFISKLTSFLNVKRVLKHLDYFIFSLSDSSFTEVDDLLVASFSEEKSANYVCLFRLATLERTYKILIDDDTQSDISYCADYYYACLGGQND